MEIAPTLTHLHCDFWEVFGAFIGDGFMNVYDGHHYVVEFSAHATLDRDYYDFHIVPAIKFLFPDANPRYYFKDGNGLQVRFYSKEIYEYFCAVIEREGGPKTHDITIPECAFEAGEDVLRSVVRGIFDTDGCIYFDERAAYKTPYPRISLQTVSKPLWKQLVQILEKEGFSLYAKELSKRDIHVVEVYGRAQLETWMETIGFSNP